MSATRDSTPRKVPRPPEAVASPTYVRAKELRNKHAIPVTMYETTDAYVLIVRQGVKALSTADTLALNFEGLRIIPVGAVVHTNELQSTHAVGPHATATEQPMHH